VPIFPNIPKIPEKWDMFLFVTGLGVLYFGIGNRWFILLGVLLLGVGIIIALGPMLEKWTLFKRKYEPTDKERRDWFENYIYSSAFILLILLIILGIWLFFVIH
jgi:magnesium-transporting ATPase (P-type)